MVRLPGRHAFFILFSMMPFLLAGCGKNKDDGEEPEPPAPGNTFVNPLLNGADPWVFRKDGFYYYTHTLGNRIGLYKTSHMSELGKATLATVYTPTPGSANAANVWAPEIHFVKGKWYIYYTAGAGPDETQRTWVLENGNTDPTTGTWETKGRIFATDTDFWAIDGSILEYNNKMYFLWSGRPVPSVQNQNIYIAEMSDPWTIKGNSALLTQPELPWETRGGPVNEGPQILKNNAGNVFMIYSASGCWTDDYALGMLRLKEGGDPMKPEDWTKSSQPVFSKSPEGNAYGPGHNSFFTSKDGSENWILYHANSSSGAGCGNKRNVRMQPFTFTNGVPDFGTPVRAGMAIDKPAGE